MPAATWIFNIGILFANEFSRGYPYAAIAQMLSLKVRENGAPVENWGTWLDSHGGLIPRWHILFNLTILRLISFNLDYYWSRQISPVEVRFVNHESAKLTVSKLSQKEKA